MEMKSVDTSRGKLRSTYMAILIPLGIVINLVGGQVAGQLKLPIFLDSIGTAIVAAIMGPFVGAVSGVMFNIIGAIIGGNILASLFGLANIATAFIIGFMARKNKFETLGQAIFATVTVAIANAIIGAPVAVIAFGGVQGSGVDVLVAGLLAAGQDVMSAAFWARIPSNLIDKGIAVFVAWLILKRLPVNLKNLTGVSSDES